ncbi:MAG: hypothetical protein OXC07_06190 [Kistimonas sp.]|nr:hypothetical protein [Kistimonas sp.]
MADQKFKGAQRAGSPCCKSFYTDESGQSESEEARISLTLETFLVENISTRAGSGAGTPVGPGQLPQAAAVMPEQRPGAVQQIPANRDQHSPPDSALVGRRVYALNAEAQQRVPENQAIHELMRERGALLEGPDGVPPATPDLPVRQARHFTGTDRVERQQLAAGPCLSDIPSSCELLAGLTGVPPAALGVALELSAHEIRGAFHWCESRCLVRTFLSALDLPLGLDKLACQLERSPLGACAVASQIRALGDRHGVRHLTSENSRTLVPDLEPLLAPLVGDLGRLGTALGVPESRLAQLKEGGLAPSREWEKGFVTAVVCSALARRRRLMPSKPELTYEEWMNLLARAGAGIDLEGVADTWRLELPPGHDSWRCYQRYVVGRVTTELMYGREWEPNKPIPLHQVWTALSAYASDLSFSQALDDGIDLRSILERGLWDYAGLFSLVKQVTAQGDDGYCLSDSTLGRLIRSRLAPEPVLLHLLRLYRSGPSVAQTDSRRLSPADLAQLSLADGAELDALDMAVALGVGAVPISRERGPDARSRAACIWQRIYSRCPGLETGQLVKVFVQFRKLDLIYILAPQVLWTLGQGDSRLEQSASALPPRMAQFIRLSQELPHCGRLVDEFIRLHNLEQQPGFCVLPGKAPHWCLLNCLALDLRLLEAWSRFAPAEHLSTLEEGNGETATGCKGDCGPDDYRCPISLAYMDDPVALIWKQGVRHFFSEKYLRQSLAITGHFHPLTRQPLSLDDIPPVDKQHLKHIHAWRVSHPEEEEDGKPFVPPCRQQLAQADSDENVFATPPE